MSEVLDFSASRYFAMETAFKKPPLSFFTNVPSSVYANIAQVFLSLRLYSTDSFLRKLIYIHYI